MAPHSPTLLLSQPHLLYHYPPSPPPPRIYLSHPPPPPRISINTSNRRLTPPPICHSLRREKTNPSFPIPNHPQYASLLDHDDDNNNFPTTPTTSSFNSGNPTHCDILSNTWWAELRGALGQRFNLEGIVVSTNVLTKNRYLLLPHLTVPDIRSINWAELHQRGFKGVVFDKDNTISLPYALTPWAPLIPSLEDCKSVFGDENVAVFSNSAGLDEFDPSGVKAAAVERAFGVRVIRHSVKKPAGGPDEIEAQLGCRSSEVVMVGDRRFTDVVYGNRNGFLTVLTEPLSGEGEPFVVRVIRKVEGFLVWDWSYRKGLKPMSHFLLPETETHLVCLKDPM